MTGATVRGVVYGILGTAVVQGILTAFGLWLSGVPRPVLLGVLAGLPVGAADRRAGGVDPRLALADGQRRTWAGGSSWRSTAWSPSPAPTA